ncbi:MAG: alpha/beta hydrolase [Jatrophihabitans sp.]|uniref:alpha/beta hydrolase n=1 Tax=Jatrophihabitans sp. TaxID=1932789 RepID=UPI003F7D03E8
MKLEPEVQAHLDAADLTGMDTADFPTLRALLSREIDRIFLLFGEPGPDVDRLVDHQVPVVGGTILVRTYHPAAEGPLPAHVLVHGGGWTTGSVHELVADATARHRTVSAECVTVLVEYRLAPEFPFPTPLDDVVAAVRWVRDHADELGVDADVITLGGSSAGANLAAATVLAAPDLDVRALLLEVPAVDLRREGIRRPVELEPERYEGVLSVTADYESVVGAYLPDRVLADSPLVSPVLADDVSVFPETFMLTAELDVLRPAAEDFARRLDAAGVPVHIECYPGALHGSPILTRTWATARRWHDDTLAILRDIHSRAGAAR